MAARHRGPSPRKDGVPAPRGRWTRKGRKRRRRAEAPPRRHESPRSRWLRRRSPSCLDHPLPSTEVLPDRSLAKTPVAERFRDRARVALVGLESDRATGPDHLASRISELDRTVADERDPRLPVANLGLETLDLGLRDVWRIRDDEVERAGEPGDEVGLDERDRKTEPLRVRPGELERVPRDVSGGEDCTWMLIGDREGDRTRSRADVDHRRGID